MFLNIAFLIIISIIPVIIYAGDTNQHDAPSIEAGVYDLRSPLYAIKNFDRLSHAVYNAPTESTRLDAIQAIRTFIDENPEDPYSMDLLEVIFEYFPLWQDKDTMPFLSKIASIQDHPKSYEALLYLLNEGNREERKFALHGLLALSQNNHHPKQLDAAHELSNLRPHFFDSPYPDLILPIFRSIAKNNKHPHQSKATLHLWWASHDPEDNDLVRIKLHEMLDDSDDMIASNAANALRIRGNKEDRARVLPVLRQLLHSANPLVKYYAALSLRECNKEDRVLALDALRRLIEMPNSPNRYHVLSTLFYSGTESDKDTARQHLYAIADDLETPDAYHALSSLIYNDTGRAFALPRMREIAFNPTHKYSFCAMQTLFYYYADTSYVFSSEILWFTL